ncbi:hypothetical protein LR48_Vigan09g207500 [Vigna angularis]|uniref:Arogenate dehydratase n=1 Tax=Phaseolus angularis TaxID=3914 RepID=A0A0L9VEC9_PHAAN|nr:hypothetical protein LR48_Vigan09g207500 [Vigna angularis]
MASATSSTLIIMALNGCSIWDCGKALQPANSTLSVNSKHDLGKCSKWRRCCSSVVNGVKSSFEYSDRVQVQITELDDGFHKDVNLLPTNDFSSRDGTQLCVAYKGLAGAYTEEAALKAYPKCETVPCDDFETSLQAVESGLVDKAVLPIESSEAGSIHHNYDLLLHHKLHIVGEVQLLINHCLLGLTGATKENLKFVLSHPQALVQCEMMLTDLAVTNIGVDDTAAAAKAVALDGRRDIGAIASSRAAKLYGLHILAEGIQDDDNISRCLILARDPILPETNGSYKTSIVFGLQEGPGVLLKALEVFGMRNINLSKIERHPVKHYPLRLRDYSKYEIVKYFDNLFYIDFEASMTNLNAQHALESLQMLMALNDCCIWGCAKAPQLGLTNFHPACSRLSVNLKEGAEKWCKRKCCCLRVSAPKALIPMEDEKAAVTGFESSGNADSELLEGFHKDVKLINTYNEDAAFKAYPNCETVPCLDSETAFKSVESWLVDKAVLPIESCIAGSIHRNYDLLIRHKLHIVGELHLLIKHCLLGLKAVKKEDLTSVMSHPQALLQCETMLTDLGVTNIAVDDTAAAARAVALEGRRDIGAIASSRAAELYGLDILAEGIQDDEANVTRFLILARDPIIPGTDRPYKTSIVFSLDEDPTVLFRALGAFALRNINLSKIESRPLKHCPLSAVDDSKEGSAKSFKYLLYIDFEASLADPRARNALENLQECTRYFRILGCYPVDDETDTTGSS